MKPKITCKTGKKKAIHTLLNDINPSKIEFNTIPGNPVKSFADQVELINTCKTTANVVRKNKKKRPLKTEYTPWPSISISMRPTIYATRSVAEPKQTASRRPGPASRRMASVPFGRFVFSRSAPSCSRLDWKRQHRKVLAQLSGQQKYPGRTRWNGRFLGWHSNGFQTIS